jgi:hypothetical protein
MRWPPVRCPHWSTGWPPWAFSAAPSPRSVPRPPRAGATNIARRFGPILTQVRRPLAVIATILLAPVIPFAHYAYRLHMRMWPEIDDDHRGQRSACSTVPNANVQNIAPIASRLRRNRHLKVERAICPAAARCRRLLARRRWHHGGQGAALAAAVRRRPDLDTGELIAAGWDQLHPQLKA